eukprot:1133621-Pelagomonas_calceolata.AAC.4
MKWWACLQSRAPGLHLKPQTIRHITDKCIPIEASKSDSSCPWGPIVGPLPAAPCPFACLQPCHAEMGFQCVSAALRATHTRIGCSRRMRRGAAFTHIHIQHTHVNTQHTQYTHVQNTHVGARSPAAPAASQGPPRGVVLPVLQDAGYSGGLHPTARLEIQALGWLHQSHPAHDRHPAVQQGGCRVCSEGTTCSGPCPGSTIA